MTGAHLVELRPGEEEADGAEETGDRRDENRADAEVLREPARVDRAGAAVGDQRELARIAALLGGDRAQRTHHPRVRDPVDPARGLEHGQAERPGDAADRLFGQLARDLDLAVRNGALGDEAEHDVGVGHRRLDPTASVAGRPGIGARAARADLEPAGRVDPRDAAAAGADLGDVDRGDPQQLARTADQPAARGHRAADLVLAAARDRAVLDQRRLRGRAAHVERDHVREPELLGDAAGGDHSRGRAGLEREDGLQLRVVGRSSRRRRTA